MTYLQTQSVASPNFFLPHVLAVHVTRLAYPVRAEEEEGGFYKRLSANKVP